MPAAPFTGALPRPSPWAFKPAESERFFHAVANAKTPLLICDYDGTLAPFQEDKMQAVPYAGVSERLGRIAAGRTRLAFVSGRPVAELMTLLPLAASVEIWGMHGREHRARDGACRTIEPTAEQRSALDQAQDALQVAGWTPQLERKIASLALHWRSLERERGLASLREAQQAAERAFTPHIGQNSLALLPFEGGLELRAEDHTKAQAVLALLEDADPSAAAFLGDDTTDEDAFRAIGERGGLGLLVRQDPRPSHAAFSLQPPDELLAFLDNWLSATAARDSSQAGPVS